MKLKILLIDDDACVRMWAERSLTKGGHVALSAPNAEVGFNMAVSEKPDLILLDLHMPGRDGLQMLRTLKQGRYTQHIPVVMFTADDYVSSMEEALELGAEGYIPKFENYSALVQSIRRIFVRGPLDDLMIGAYGRTDMYH